MSGHSYGDTADTSSMEPPLYRHTTYDARIQHDPYHSSTSDLSDAGPIRHLFSNDTRRTLTRSKTYVRDFLYQSVCKSFLCLQYLDLTQVHLQDSTFSSRSASDSSTSLSHSYPHSQRPQNHIHIGLLHPVASIRKVHAHIISRLLVPRNICIKNHSIMKNGTYEGGRITQERLHDIKERLA